MQKLKYFQESYVLFFHTVCNVHRSLQSCLKEWFDILKGLRQVAYNPERLNKETDYNQHSNYW